MTSIIVIFVVMTLFIQSAGWLVCLGWMYRKLRLMEHANGQLKVINYIDRKLLPRMIVDAVDSGETPPKRNIRRSANAQHRNQSGGGNKPDEQSQESQEPGGKEMS